MINQFKEIHENLKCKTSVDLSRIKFTIKTNSIFPVQNSQFTSQLIVLW